MSRRTSSETSSPPVPLFEYQGMLLGGNPSTERLVEAVAQGFVVLVDMRAELEIDPATRAKEMAALGLRFMHIPIVCAADLERAARELHMVLAKETGPFIVHCKSGNRVGAAFAVRAHRQLNYSAEEALAIGLEAGLARLEPEVRELLGC